MYLLFIPLYFSFYRSVNDKSPSFKILQVLQKQPETGAEKLLAAIEEENYIPLTLSAMVKNGHVRQKEGKFSLTKRGKFIAIFSRLDKMMFKRSLGV